MHCSRCQVLHCSRCRCCIRCCIVRGQTVLGSNRLSALVGTVGLGGRAARATAFDMPRNTTTTNRHETRMGDHAPFGQRNLNRTIHTTQAEAKQKAKKTMETICFRTCKGPLWRGRGFEIPPLRYPRLVTLGTSQARGAELGQGAEVRVGL